MHFDKLQAPKKTKTPTKTNQCNRLFLFADPVSRPGALRADPSQSPKLSLCSLQRLLSWTFGSRPLPITTAVSVFMTEVTVPPLLLSQSRNICFLLCGWIPCSCLAEVTVRFSLLLGVPFDLFFC